MAGFSPESPRTPVGQAGSGLGAKGPLPLPETQWARFPTSLGLASVDVKSRGDLKVPELHPAQREVGSVILVVEASTARSMNSLFRNQLATRCFVLF